MKLELHLDETPFVLQVKNEDGLILKMDAAASIGGKGTGFRPMEVLASSLAGCMSIDVLAILRKQRLDVTEFTVSINATRKEAVPATFETIELVFSVNQSVPLEKLSHAVHLSHDKYCSVSASLHPSIQITTTCQHV
ncbi:MAG: OsmC family protein [Fluviicola sp.]|jgi:putative redox protein|nr:OsmC family protein [Fluviicola sp.]